MSKFNFKKIKNNLEQLKLDLPPLLAACAQQYHLCAFAAQGWDGVHWAEVQRRQQGTNAYKYPKNKGLSRRTAPILKGSGLLQRQVGTTAGSAQLTHNNNGFTVTLLLDDSAVPYGKFINTGTPNMPQRKFMGDSEALRKILLDKVKKDADGIWE